MEGVWLVVNRELIIFGLPLVDLPAFEKHVLCFTQMQLLGIGLGYMD